MECAILLKIHNYTSSQMK